MNSNLECWPPTQEHWLTQIQNSFGKIKDKYIIEIKRNHKEKQKQKKNNNFKQFSITPLKNDANYGQIRSS